MLQLSLEIHKAFDSSKPAFLDFMLRRMDWGPHILQAISALYNNLQT